MFFGVRKCTLGQIRPPFSFSLHLSNNQSQQHLWHLPKAIYAGRNPSLQQKVPCQLHRYIFKDTIPLGTFRPPRPPHSPASLSFTTCVANAAAAADLCSTGSNPRAQGPNTGGLCAGTLSTPPPCWPP